MGFSVSGDLAYQPYRQDVYSTASRASLSLDTRLANLQPEEENTLTTIMLPNLYAAETGIGTASASLNVDSAGVFKRNPTEISDRVNHYRYLRYDLCTFLGFSPGPMLAAVNRVTRA